MKCKTETTSFLPVVGITALGGMYSKSKLDINSTNKPNKTFVKAKSQKFVVVFFSLDLFNFHVHYANSEARE